MVEEANNKADSIKNACESYLSEESQLRKSLKKAKEQLEEVQLHYKDDVATLNAEIELWMSKYEIDT